MSYPTKEDRATCWGAKDKYWECLDKNKLEESVKDGPCVEFRKVYEQSCSKQWVKHFDRKRSYNIYKENFDAYVSPENPNYKSQT